MGKNNTENPATRPYVLVCNDDGIVAPGIAALICALQPTCDLVIVAPDGPRSGAACAITSTTPISYRLVNDEPGLRAYACSGTPTDCAKLGIDEICERRPDLLVSGVNLGNNASINTLYSGTMGAATEGCIKGIPSIGFSLDTFDPSQANYSVCTEYIQLIVSHVLRHGLPPHVMLNVNFPTTVETPKGIRVCRMAMGDWEKEYERINSPRGGNHFWMTGEYKLLDQGNDHDMAALAEGYVSIVPQTIDMTATAAMKGLMALATPTHSAAAQPAEPTSPAMPSAPSTQEPPKKKKKGNKKAATEAPQAEQPIEQPAAEPETAEKTETAPKADNPVQQEPEPQPKREQKPQAEQKPKKEPKTKAGKKPKTEQQTVKKQPEAERQTIGNPPQAEPKPQAEKKPKADKKPKTEQKPKAGKTPKAEPKPKTEKKSKAEKTPKAPAKPKKPRAAKKDDTQQ